MTLRKNDTQHNNKKRNSQHNDTQHDNKKRDTQNNDTQHNNIQHTDTKTVLLSDPIGLIMRSVIMLNMLPLLIVWP
jgi:hypothetical protein